MYIIGNNADYAKALYSDYSSLYSDLKDIIHIKDGILYNSNDKPISIGSSSVLLAVTEPKQKLKLVNILNAMNTGVQYPTYKIGYGLVDLGFTGNIIGKNVVIDYNSSIGEHNTIKHNAVISFSCKIGNFNYVGPSATIMNNCTIGNMNKIAGNTNISEFITIGDNNSITPGECLFEDLGANKKFQNGVVYKQ